MPKSSHPALYVVNSDTNKPARKKRSKTSTPSAETSKLFSDAIRFINIREIMLKGGSDVVVPIPEKVEKAVKKKALEMAVDAYKISIEYIYRKGVARAQYNPDNYYLDEKMALYHIENCSLDKALAHDHLDAIGFAKSLGELIVFKCQEMLHEIEKGERQRKTKSSKR